MSSSHWILSKLSKTKWYLVTAKERLRYGLGDTVRTDPCYLPLPQMSLHLGALGFAPPHFLFTWPPFPVQQITVVSTSAASSQSRVLSICRPITVLESNTNWSPSPGSGRKLRQRKSIIAWTKWIVAAVRVRVAVPREVPAIFCPTEKSVVASVSPGAWTFPDKACYMLHKYTSYMCYTMLHGPSPIEHGVSGAISSDLYRHHFWEDFLNFPFLFPFPVNLCCI